MSGKYDEIKKEIEQLEADGNLLLESLLDEIAQGKAGGDDDSARFNFMQSYQGWYGLSSTVIENFTPSRLDEFKKYYYDEKRGALHNNLNYSIQDYIIDNRPMKHNLSESLIRLMNVFSIQIQILSAAAKTIDSNLGKIKSIVQADLFDSEIEIAKELLKTGFLRASGVVAAVVLDKHLKELCENHEIKIKKKKPMLGDYNQALFDANVIEMTTYRRIQHLAELRALCAHDKDREPAEEEIDELIRGVDTIIKTSF